MITYSVFNLLLIEACRNEAGMHLNKNNVDEAEVPVEHIGGGIIYLQFINVLGTWVYVGIRK